MCVAVSTTGGASPAKKASFHLKVQNTSKLLNSAGKKMNIMKIRINFSGYGSSCFLNVKNNGACANLL